MKKLLILFVFLYSCYDQDTNIINCDCGVVELLGQTGICYYVGVRNECTGNYKNVCFPSLELQQAYILGERQCNPKFNY